MKTQEERDAVLADAERDFERMAKDRISALAMKLTGIDEPDKHIKTAFILGFICGEGQGVRNERNRSS